MAAVKRGVLLASGFPVDFPTILPGETLLKPMNSPYSRSSYSQERLHDPCGEAFEAKRRVGDGKADAVFSGCGVGLVFQSRISFLKISTPV